MALTNIILTFIGGLFGFIFSILLWVIGKNRENEKIKNNIQTLFKQEIQANIECLNYYLCDTNNDFNPKDVQAVLKAIRQIKNDCYDKMYEKLIYIPSKYLSLSLGAMYAVNNAKNLIEYTFKKDIEEHTANCFYGALALYEDICKLILAYPVLSDLKLIIPGNILNSVSNGVLLTDILNQRAKSVESMKISME
jgi:hypothetical protein